MTACEEHVANWPVDLQPIAAAICRAESGGRIDAHCLDCAGVAEDSRGLFQINFNVWRQFDGDRLLSDPDYNSAAALEVYNAQGFRAWSTYTSGRYLQFMGADPIAAAAASAATDSPLRLFGGVPPAVLAVGAAAIALWAIGEL